MTNQFNDPRDPIMQKYKYRDLKVYNSVEWLADNKKKYRQVFDRYETTHIFAELSFYNKLFDVEDWDVNINIKCFAANKSNKEICDLNYTRKVSKYDHIFYLREGWGNKKLGAFWRKGMYYWEAYIDGEKVDTKTFYIEETSKKQLDPSAYIELRSLKLYEDDYDNNNQDNRVFYKTFSKTQTRYIYSQIILDNKLREQQWHCELIVKFFNGARQLKGQYTSLLAVEPNQETIQVDARWGSNIRGSWTEGNYTAEIIFMDQLLAIIPFEVGDDFVEGIAGTVLPNQYMPVVIAHDTAEEEEDSFDFVMKSLDQLTGLEEVKKKIREHADYLKFLQLRRERGFVEKDEVTVHAVFSGNPGTGKTTVANMMGKLYKNMGLLSRGHVHEVDRVDLVGEYIGQTAPKVKEAIEKARGGVLFIDEAYALARANDDSKDFGREVIEILIKEMSNGPGDLAIIVAGYPKEMKHFLESNPGLKSRFKLNFDFADYMPDELMEIAEYTCEKKNISLSPEAKDLLNEIVIESYRNRDRTFGNARFINDILDKAKMNLGLRIMQMPAPRAATKEELTILSYEDVNKVEIERPKRIPNLPIDEKLLNIALHELNHLIGMNNIKQEINEMVRLVRFYRESNRNVLNKFFLHTLFVGNPGTGKTTVARILTKIYKALGILERGHMVETDRQGLVAGYVGQTAIKTSEKIDEAMGGVLFIDEAYALTSGVSGNMGGSSDFGNEAIQIILKRMEDSRGEFFIFAAGYPDNMEAFLKANPGLRSRFDKILKFEDYSADELLEIATLMIQDEKLTINEEAKNHLAAYLHFIYNGRDKYFGNARDVRNVINEVTKNQSLRLAAIPLEERDEAMLNVITYEDVATLKLSHDDSVFNKKTIGFRSESGR